MSDKAVGTYTMFRGVIKVDLTYKPSIRHRFWSWALLGFTWEDK